MPTKIMMLLALVTASCLVTTACTEPESEPSSPTKTPAASPPTPTPNYDGPSFTFEVTPDGAGTLFEWEVTVPTGGWALTFDGAQSHPSTKHAVVRVVLVRPGPEEMVTQALQTLEGDYRHAKLDAKSAELLVQYVTRDVDEEDGLFLTAATWSASE